MEDSGSGGTGSAVSNREHVIVASIYRGVQGLLSFPMGWPIPLKPRVRCSPPVGWPIPLKHLVRCAPLGDELEHALWSMEDRLSLNEIKRDIQRLNETVKEKKKTAEELERPVLWSDLGDIDLQPLRRSQSLVFVRPQMVKNKSDVGKLTHGRHVFKRALDTDKIKRDIQRLNEDLKEKKKTAEELVAEKKSDDGRHVFKLAPVPELDTVNLPGQNQEDPGKPAEITVTLRDPAVTAAAMAAMVGAEAAAAA